MYNPIVTHFLSYAKENDYELLRVADADEEDVTYLVTMRLTNTSMEQTLRQALAIGTAKERERMGKFAEWVDDTGWCYNKESKKWFMIAGFPYEPAKTTSELIEIFNTQNKEG